MSDELDGLECLLERFGLSRWDLDSEEEKEQHPCLLFEKRGDAVTVAWRSQGGLQLAGFEGALPRCQALSRRERPPSRGVRSPWVKQRKREPQDPVRICLEQRR